MNTALAAILVPALVVLSGHGLRHLLRWREGSPAWELAAAIALGIAVCGVVGPLASIVGIDVAPAVVATQAALAAAGAWFLWHRVRRGEARFAPVRLAPLALFVGLVAIVGINAARRAVLFGDEVYAWGYKAAMILASGRIQPQDWADVGIRGPSYPFALPAAGAAAGLVAGHACGHVLRILTVAIYAGFVAILLEVSQEYVPRGLRLAFAFGLAALPIVENEAVFYMADILLTLGIFLACRAIARGPGSIEAAVWCACLPLFKIDGVAIGALLLLVNAAAAPRGARARVLLASACAAALAAGPWLAVFVREGFDPFVVRDRGGTFHVFGVGDAVAQPIVFAERVEASAAGVLAAFAPSFGSFELGGSGIVGSWPFGALIVVLVCLAFLEPAEPAAAPARVRLAAGLCVVAGQFVGIAATPYDVPALLLALSARAALHIVPGLLMIVGSARALVLPPTAEGSPTRRDC